MAKILKINIILLLNLLFLYNVFADGPSIGGVPVGRIASTTNSGLIDTNSLLKTMVVADQQIGASHLPPLGIASWYGAWDHGREFNNGSIAGTSNAVYWASIHFYNHGYRYVILDDGWASTDRDSNGNIQWNSNYPSGTNFVNLIHQRGWKLGLYYDNGNPLSIGSLQAGSGTHIIGDTATICSWGTDYIKADVGSFNRLLIASILATNGLSTYFQGGIGLDRLSTIDASILNSFRIVAGGDISSFSILMQWCDVAMNNNWNKFVRPGHFIDMDYIGAGGLSIIEQRSHLVICALYSAPIYYDGSFTSAAGPSLTASTNNAIIDIDQDSAVICAQRILQTNNCDVYIKPLGSPNGPNYALGIINRSNVTVNVSMLFTNIPNLVNIFNSRGNYSVYDCVSNAWLGQSLSGFSVDIPSHDCILWKLVPNTAITQIYPGFPYDFTFTNGIYKITQIKWDNDVSNFCAQAGVDLNDLVTRSALNKFVYKLKYTPLPSGGLAWSKIDDFWPICGGSSNSASWSFKRLVKIVWTSAPNFNDYGVAGDGSTVWGDTGFNPSVNGTAYTLNSAHMCVYLQTASPTTGTYWFGAGGSDNNGRFYMSRSSSSVAISGIHNTEIGITHGGISDFRGFIMASRTSSTSQYVSVKGDIASGSTTAAVAMPSVNFAILALYFGSAQGFTDARLSYASVGGGFSTTDQEQYRIWVDEFQDDLNRKQ